MMSCGGLMGAICKSDNCKFWLKLVTCLLSLGQTDSQVVVSSVKLNLRRDLHWVAKRADKFPHKYT